MRTISIDTEYDYMTPFLATTTDDELVSRVYRPNILSQKKALKKICEDRNIRKVFHHASGDMLILRNIDIEVQRPYDCTLIAANLVNENYSSRNLKKLVQEHLGIETKESNRLRSTIKKYREIAKREGRRFRWSEIPEEVMLPYAKKDPEYTLQLWYYWQQPISEVRELYEFEKSIIPIIVDMCWKGLRIDRYMCARKSREYGRNIEILYEQMTKFIVDNKIDFGKEFNPRSPKQMQTLVLSLIENGKISEGDITRTEKTWVPKTDKKALAKLCTSSVFFKWLTQFRFFTKHKGTYYDPLYEYYTSEDDDTAHFMLYQTGAKSGRFSAELAQTLPRPEDSVLADQKHEVRKAVIPRRRKAFLCKDYEQQEMRLFVHYSDCKRMIDIINEKGGRGIDIYVETAELMFGKKFDNPKYRKPLRFVTKHNALGMIYGEGQRKLISSTGVLLLERFGQEIIDELGVTEQWAYETLQRFYRLYPVREFMDAKISELYKTGVLRMAFDSPLMKFDRVYRVPQDKAYKSVNILIQGTAAYVIKHAMKRVDERIKREGWENRVSMLMQVHDELIFEVDDDLEFIKHVDSVLTEEMEDWETFKVPITCSAKWSNKSWGDVVDLK